MFDPARVQDHATFEKPHQDATGMVHVFVNGVAITSHGASRVLATHGHAEPLARYLGEQGLQSGIIRTAWEEGAED